MTRELHFLKVALDAVQARSVCALENAYQLHCWIEGLKQKDHDREQDRILWRMDHSKQGTAPVVLIQTNFTPNPSGLKAMAKNAMIQSVAEKKVRPLFQEHQVFRFRLRANATKTPFRGEGKRGRREPVLGAGDAETWLVRKGAHHGFSCSLFNLVEEGPVHLRKENKQQKNRPPMTFNSILYEGMLQVRDPEAMATVVEKGLGRGKGFGFGLISLARR